jgi:hypothetical protein
LTNPDRGVPRPKTQRFIQSFYHRREGRAIVQGDPQAKGLQGLFIGRPFDLNPIGFGEFVMRVCDPILKAAVIGQYQESFAVVIETPRGSNLWKVHKIFKG